MTGIREVVEGILRDCRIPKERQREVHEQIAKAVWRDRVEVMGLMNGGRRQTPGGVDLRVARFVQSQASGQEVRPL